jgi:hypothetical protein
MGCTGPGECGPKKGYVCNPQYCQGDNPGVFYRELGSMLQKVPRPQRQQYLDSVDFKGGRFSSGDVKNIEKHLEKAELEQLAKPATK